MTLPRPPLWAIHAFSIVATVFWGSAIVIGANVAFCAAGLAAVWVGFYVGEPWLMPGEVARTELPGGGSAWVRQGQGPEGLSTLFVSVPGRPTERWNLPRAGVLGRPTLLVGKALAVRGEGGYVATLDWRSGTFTSPGGVRGVPDGLVDRWGRWVASAEWQALRLEAD